MIWQSVSAMTVIDLLIVGGAIYCLWVFRKFGRRLSRRKSKTGSVLLLAGIFIISIFYVGDLFTMHALPLVIPHAEAMAAMAELHLNYAWITALTGISFIVAGSVWFNSSTFRILEDLARSEKKLRSELDARLREQTALGISTANLANAQRIARVGSWDWNLVTNGLRWSDEMYRIFGRDPRDLGATYDAFLEAVHPDDRLLVDDTITRAIHERAPYNVDHRIVLPDGSENVVHQQGDVVHDDAGKPIHMSGTVQDITRRKAVEQALRDAKQRFRDFAEASSDWFWELGPDLRFTWVSDRLLGSTGRSREYFIGHTTRELESPSTDPEKWGCYLDQLDAHEAIRGFYFKRKREDGGELDIRLSLKPIFAPDGTFKGYRGTGRDFTSESAAEAKIERVRDQFLNAIEYISEGIALFDENERLVFSNGQFREFVVAKEVATPFGTKFEDLVRANVRAGLLAVPEQMVEEWIVWRLERFRNPGGPFELVITGRHLLIHEQRLPGGGTIHVHSDITEIKEREEQLRQSQKMEVVGQLTGGVAHDFNNVLAVISGNLELLEERLADREDHREFVRKCLDAAGRGATLTQRLLAFSRKQPLTPQSVDAGLLVKDLPSLLHRTLGEDIAIETSVPDDLWAVFADPVQLENALLNLAINARDAMPSGGRLTIEATNRVVGRQDAMRLGELAAGEYVMIAVSDTGCGMPPDVVEKAFEPFFTTKPSGKGSGLGLSMVYGFSRQSNGEVVIDSAPGRGTSVSIFLPRSKQDAAQAVTGTKEAIVAGNGESVLVVEDDPAVRELATNMLDSLNYRVIAANDGPAALDSMDSAGGIDLLFTDIVLPKTMDGVELARQALTRWPDLKVLYTSGYTDRSFAGDCAPSDGTRLLNKPYYKAELARSIRTALDQPARM